MYALFLAGMSDAELENVAQSMEEIVVPCGHVIIRQDDIGETFYILEEGEVLVTVSNIYYILYCGVYYCFPFLSRKS